MRTSPFASTLRSSTISLLVGTLATAFAGQAAAQTAIAAGGSVSGSVDGTASIYQLFGHSGTTEASQAAATTDAPYLSFGAGNVFTFTSVTGGVNCCSNPGDLFTPDGRSGASTGVLSLNGLSPTVGNTALGLVAVFTSNTDPAGGVAPAALAYDASAPASLAPALNQVFYVGDGRQGLDNPAGALLSFTAPVGATRLYIGFADAFSFNGASSYYQDNPGSVSYTVALSAVPEPSSVVLGGFGMAAAIALTRRRRVAA